MGSRPYIYIKLSAFIRLYYIYSLIRGAVYLFAASVFAFLIFSFSEAVFYFSPNIKQALVYTFSAVFSVLILWFIAKPLLLLAGLLKPMDFTKASTIISSHFTDIKDQLINLLELAEQGAVADDNSMLIAAIEQKTSKLNPIPFALAIDKQSIVRASYFLLFVILFFIGSYLSIPDIKESTKRILLYEQEFERPSPFNYIVLSELIARQGDNFTLSIKIEGSLKPESVQIVAQSGTFFMVSQPSGTFEHEFRTLASSQSFYFTVGKYRSRNFNLKVLPSPQLSNFTISVLPPKYTGAKAFEIKNYASESIPEGSSVTWQLSAPQADSVFIFINRDTASLVKNKASDFMYQTILKESVTYNIKLKNQHFSDSSVSGFGINIIKDAYPRITVEEKKLPSSPLVSYFRGTIADDYGFTSLRFSYAYGDSVFYRNLTLQPGLKAQEFFFDFDFSAFSQAASLQYNFIVYDNDAVNGPKYSKSQSMFFSVPSEDALARIEDATNKQVEDKIDESIKLAKEIQEDISELKTRVLNDNLNEWQRNQVLQSIEDKHNQLKDLLQQANEINEQKNSLFDSLSEKEELKQKQQELQDLLSKVMDDELQSLLDELSKLKENFDRNKMFQMTEQLEMSYQDLEKRLDKDIELLKRYDIERRVDNTIDALRHLADKLEEMSAASSPESNEELESMAEQLKEMQDSYKEMQESNSQLSRPMDMQDFSDDFSNISNDISKAKDQLEQGKPKESSGSMQKGSEKSEQLADKMQAMMDSNKQSEAMEDINNLRQILDNLVSFSFDQEHIMDKYSKIRSSDPIFSEYTNRQNRLRENFNVIKDSLYSLAKRQPMISNTVSAEVLAIQSNLKYAQAKLEDTQVRGASVNQRYVMTAANNLALMLSQILKNMQEAMASDMEGQQNCQNPGAQGKPGLSGVKSQQQGLKQQLQNMIDQMKQQGEGGQQPGKSMSKELSKLLYEQEMYKQQLDELMQGGDLSPESMRQLNDIKRLMEQNERDIVNKNISRTTISRQDQIMSRLLEAEKAEREREYDNQRKSSTAEQNIKRQPADIIWDEAKQYQYGDVINRSYIDLDNTHQKIYEDFLIKLSSDN
jgi:hypothetical protein